ncbi:hypothetical protein XENTR_v10006991 [Xenopus tropicalis]|uniref:APC membrane recruitment protein 2 n=1 Tax=Xenopus tropicalis TaxID=8364 RepID=AMER2_XENTR|nr:APC membrane recruitment protein 2 [Xenopus tropicalis]A4IGN8.2 RecName: Full=APC membrane recruitment protein 2; Short=Amer2; AltName: Full=Protein FAM123A [Xenopus tropicalis]KAE8627434.1 hypothetical protein XENTR_v10006991 [Xenopus tropicalis]|eukprot:NP_001263429.1 APC membrane recruitment protein 2 [Xenopus tropicalis]
MDLHYDCAESPAAEQPSGKINKTAFKLFGKRKSGSGMPTIFGVKNKGDSKGTGKIGMVRSKTLDGLADVVLESNKKEEPCTEAGAGQLNPEKSPKVLTINADVSSNSSVAKSHSFFSLLKKNGKSENVRGEQAEQKAGSRQKRGLKGLFNSMRWSKKDKSYKDDKEGASESQPGLILPSSLTASLECIKEETQKPLCEKGKSTEDIPADVPLAEHSGDVNTSAEENSLKASEESPCSALITEQPQLEDAPLAQLQENLCQLPQPEVETLQNNKDEHVTGCGDVIADQDDDGGSSMGSKLVPGNGKKVMSKKNTNIVAYQGGGEEMASPEQVDETYVQELFSMIPPSEGASEKTEKVNGTTQASREVKCSDSAQDRNAIKPSKLKQVPVYRKERGDQNSKANEKRQCLRNSDEGYWDSPTPGQEEEEPRSVGKQALARDSCSGDALYDLYTDPDESIAKAQVEEPPLSHSHSKPLSPVTTSCPVKTASSNKESKIPISIKHLPVHTTNQGTDSSSGSATGHPHPVKSELPRTKIPVSKVLVRRVSNKAITETAAGKRAIHDPARKHH